MAKWLPRTFNYRVWEMSDYIKLDAVEGQKAFCGTGVKLYASACFFGGRVPDVSRNILKLKLEPRSCQGLFFLKQ